jgi:hypothetical protein
VCTLICPTGHLLEVTSLFISTRVQFSDDGLQVMQVISGSDDDGTVLVSPILRANPACRVS